MPKGRSMLATVRKDHFELVPLNIVERCTPLSVAAHTLYEKTRPDILPGPGGELHLHQAQYKQLDDGRTVRICGAVFKPTPYEVKLEGARIMGHRTVFIGGVRDPILVSQIDEFLAAVHACKSRMVLSHLKYQIPAASSLLSPPGRLNASCCGMCMERSKSPSLHRSC